MLSNDQLSEASQLGLLIRPENRHRLGYLATRLNRGGGKLLCQARRVQLTDAGSVFHARCLHILRDIDRSCTMTQAVAGKDVGEITIGTIHPATFGVLPHFIARISNRYPDICIHIHNGTTDSIVREIERGQINLAFIRPDRKYWILTLAGNQTGKVFVSYCVRQSAQQ